MMAIENDGDDDDNVGCRCRFVRQMNQGTLCTLKAFHEIKSISSLLCKGLIRSASHAITQTHA